MKKSLIVVAAVVAPALMVMAQPGKDKQPGKPAGAPGGTPAAQPSKGAPASKADSELTGQVEKAWAAIAKQDWETFGSMLSDEFVLVTGTGVQDKAATIEGLKGMKMKSSKFSDWRTVKLNENAAAVVYKVAAVWTGPDGADMTEITWCSDAMARQGGKWMISMHQETAIKAADAKP